MMNYKFDKALAKDPALGVRNGKELSHATYRLRKATEAWRIPEIPWPADAPTAIVEFPEKPFAPDFWTFGGRRFASRRLRDALAQPADVVEFHPVELRRGSAAAYEQEYCWMRVIAMQEALDLTRCNCRIEEEPHAVTGEPIRFLSDIEALALRENLFPRTEMFHIAEERVEILVTDAVAERVLHARCTGVELSDPTNSRGGKRIDRFRTLDGIGERRIGY